MGLGSSVGILTNLGVALGDGFLDEPSFMGWFIELGVSEEEDPDGRVDSVLGLWVDDL